MESHFLVTALIGLIAFLFSVYKYWDTKNAEAKSKRFDQFHRIFDWVAGRNADGHVLTAAHQTVAIYELAEFPEYKHLSLPVIDYYLETDSDNPVIRDALIYSKEKLSR